MHCLSTRRVIVVVAVLAAIVAHPIPAQAYRRGRSYSYSAMRARHQQYLNQAANAQLNAAKQVLAAAESTAQCVTSRARAPA